MFNLCTHALLSTFFLPSPLSAPFFYCFLLPFLEALFPFDANDFQVEIQIVDMARSVLVVQLHEKLAQSNDGPCSDPNVPDVPTHGSIKRFRCPLKSGWRTLQACDFSHLHFQRGLLIPTQLRRSVLPGLLFVLVHIELLWKLFVFFGTSNYFPIMSRRTSTASPLW